MPAGYVLKIPAAASNDEEHAATSSAAVEPEPEDENPEEEDVEGDLQLDSNDEEDVDHDKLTTFEEALGNRKVVAVPPDEKQLEFKNKEGKALVGRHILYNWTGLGWWLGRISRQSGDKNKMIKLNGKRQPANYVVTYDTGDTGPHGLVLETYGKRGPRDFERWVLLEE